MNKNSRKCQDFVHHDAFQRFLRVTLQVAHIYVFYRLVLDERGYVQNLSCANRPARHTASVENVAKA